MKDGNTPIAVWLASRRRIPELHSRMLTARWITHDDAGNKISNYGM
jgi:hypothetical protein